MLIVAVKCITFSCPAVCSVGCCSAGCGVSPSSSLLQATSVSASAAIMNSLVLFIVFTLFRIADRKQVCGLPSVSSFAEGNAVSVNVITSIFLIPEIPSRLMSFGRLED
jgi:hypothetical protein